MKLENILIIIIFSLIFLAALIMTCSLLLYKPTPVPQIIPIENNEVKNDNNEDIENSTWNL